MSKIGDKEAAQRAMREARFNRESRQGKMLDLSSMSGGPTNAAKPKPKPVFPEIKAQAKQPDGGIEHPAGRRKREIDTATTGDFKDSVEVVQQAADAVKEKFGKKQLLVRLDPPLIKELKIAAAEREITIERAVELAVKEWLES